MPNLFRPTVPLSRRRLIVGAGFAGATAALIPAAVRAAPPARLAAAGGTGAIAESGDGALPVKAIEKALQTTGSTMHGIFSIELDRKDLKITGPHGIPVKPAWQLQHEFYFQALSSGRAIMNMDMCLRPDELQAVIDQLLAHGMQIQAEHQHFYNFSPMVYFIHARAMGDPVKIADGLAAAVKATATPMPQQQPSHKKTPFDVRGLERIMGATSQVGGDGTVTFFVPRAEAITLGGVKVSPYLNIATNIAFEPLDAAGKRAAAAPDFAMTAGEIDNVLRVMRKQGFEVGCLYNQETDEHPQLFFSHQLGIGTPEELARAIRQGLDQTKVHYTA